MMLEFNNRFNTHYLAKSTQSLIQFIEIQMFQSRPRPQMYKRTKNLGMQTGSTNICKRMGCFQELNTRHLCVSVL